MVTKNQKEETIVELQGKFAKAKAVFTTKQLGLSVAQITELRNNIRPLNAEFKVAKNTLFRKAAEGTPYADLTKELKGPIALLFCYEDQVAPAGKIKLFGAANDEKVAINSAYLDGELLDAAKATKIAGLPSREILLSQIAGMLVQPASMIAYILKELGEKEAKDALLKDFIVASPVEASSDKEKEGE